MTDFAGLLRCLLEAHVEFVLVGGVAGNVRGVARATYDVDVVYARSDANLERLVAALAPLHPYLRGAPPGLPFILDIETLRRGLNFTLRTSAGDIDLLGEVIGAGRYEDLTRPATPDSQGPDAQPAGQRWPNGPFANVSEQGQRTAGVRSR